MPRRELNPREASAQEKNPSCSTPEGKNEYLRPSGKKRSSRETPLYPALTATTLRRESS